MPTRARLTLPSPRRWVPPSPPTGRRGNLNGVVGITATAAGRPRAAACCRPPVAPPPLLLLLARERQQRRARCGGFALMPRRQVFVDRPVAELGHQILAAALGDHLRHRRVRVAEIAEVPRARRTDHHAGRHPLILGKIIVVDAVDAQGAFLHHTVVFVELARAIGAGPRTQLAADADIGVDQHDPVLGALVRRAGRAHGDAGRLLAMQARARKMHGARAFPVTLLERMDAVEPHPP